MSDEEERRVPLVEERARVGKRVVERNVVRIRTTAKENQFVISDALRREEVDIRRVPVNREIDAMPDVREEGGVVVIPVVEERPVVIKRLILVEELHVHRKLVQENVELPVTLRSTEVFVEADDASNGDKP